MAEVEDMRKGALAPCFLIIVLLLYLQVPSSASEPLLVVLANPIDYDLAYDFFGFLSSKGVEVVRTDSLTFDQHKNEKFIVILGGPDAYDGIGEIVRGILLDEEQDYLRVSGNWRMYKKTNVFSDGQIVFVIAGSGREQTQFAHMGNKGILYDVVEFLKDISSLEISSQENRPACENKYYNMGFILLVKNSSDATPKRLNKLSTIKNEFSKSFYVATGNKARMDTSDDIYIVNTESSMFDHFWDESSNFVIPNEVTKEFFKEHSDIYDFISIYTTFPTKKLQSHGDVIQNIKGIGQNTKGGPRYPIGNYSRDYGSKGRLRGVNFMTNIDGYDISDPVSLGFSVNGLLHETGHQWCCYVGDNFARGEDGAELEIIQQGIHFYRGLQSPYGTSTAMNSDYWVPNEDDTYRRESTLDVHKYHPFQLYFMGLLPEEEFDTKFQIYDAGIVGKDFNDQNATFYKNVSVRDIIAVEGKRTCVEQIECPKTEGEPCILNNQ